MSQQLDDLRLQLAYDRDQFNQLDSSLNDPEWVQAQSSMDLLGAQNRWRKLRQAVADGESKVEAIRAREMAFNARVDAVLQSAASLGASERELDEMRPRVRAKLLDQAAEGGTGDEVHPVLAENLAKARERSLGSGPSVNNAAYSRVHPKPGS